MANIENVHLLEDVFGRFPSFHDAEVVRIVLNRENLEAQANMEAQIHVFEVTSEIKDGQYVLTKHSLVTFQFVKIDGLELNGFNHQNVLQDLSVRDISDHQLENLRFEVTFEGIFGVEAHFRCHSVKVVSVSPFSN